jgi:hypothetical protein
MMRRRRFAGLLGIALLASLVLAGAVGAAVFSQFERASAKRGEVVRAIVDPWTAANHPPLYLALASKVCRPISCTLVSVGAPLGRPYIRLQGVVWGRSDVVSPRVRFRVPRVKAGRYRLVIYCEPCQPGPRGSLIGSDNQLRVR